MNIQRVEGSGMNYKQRRQLIQQLVEENHIATQEELLELLKKQDNIER